jgi:hypothetical protein
MMRMVMIMIMMMIMMMMIMMMMIMFIGIFEGTNRELYASLFQGQLLAVAFSGDLACCCIAIIITCRDS